MIPSPGTGRRMARIAAVPAPVAALATPLTGPAP